MHSHMNIKKNGINVHFKMPIWLHKHTKYQQWVTQNNANKHKNVKAYF